VTRSEEDFEQEISALRVRVSEIEKRHELVGPEPTSTSSATNSRDHRLEALLLRQVETSSAALARLRELELEIKQLRDAVASAAPQSKKRKSGARCRVRFHHFWATTCPPCVRELPEIVKFSEVLTGLGVEVVFIAEETEHSVDSAKEQFGAAGGKMNELQIHTESTSRLRESVGLKRFIQPASALTTTAGSKMIANGVLNAKRQNDLKARAASFIRACR
jgi:thiol-disulfide isomerase/thioredoxin